MNALCVFCGSNPGADPAYAEAAADLGRALAERGVTVVYGGGRVGLMGVLADAALASGGAVTGVIPEALATKELAHEGLTDLRVVGSMHERKALMSELADGFIALPGGIGTLEEWFEVWTWSQLGFQPKPCGMLNVAGYYDHLLAFLDHMTAQRFLSEPHRSMAIVEQRAALLLDRMAAYQPPRAAKWIDRTER
ncbi:MAG TPA: TIGR00730 family Rossman fold protein [Thermoanaerobaculia bacterium]|nr:TIGR00730 family Rossman fold protein [Thermoanaerobaculia bacterium]